MVIAKKKKTTPLQSVPTQYLERINDIYKRFELKASEISAKNFQAFESSFKKLDYLEINYLLHQLSQLKVLGH